MKDLKSDFKYYLDHQAELVSQYNGQHIVIRDGEVVGAFDTRDEALKMATREYEIGTFLIQLVGSGDENHTRMFHSRVGNAKAI